jgi:hypothetical protein
MNVQHEWIDVGTELGNNERYAMYQEPVDEMDVPRQPVELRNRDLAFAFSGHIESACQLRPKLERVRSLARLDLGKFSDNLEPVRLREALQCLALGLKPQAQPLLP